MRLSGSHGYGSFASTRHVSLQLQDMTEGEGGRHLKLKESRLKEAEMRLNYLEKERQRLEEENIKKERETAVSDHSVIVEFFHQWELLKG